MPRGTWSGSAGKKILLSGAVIIIFAGYAIYQNSHSATQTIPTAAVTTTTQTTTSNNSGAQTQTASGSTPPATTTQSGSTASGNTASGSAGTQTTSQTQTAQTGQYKDGTYTGSAVDAFYGTVQVSAVVSGGKLTNVQIIQAPQDRGHSAELTQIAMPQLTSEAISAQSASVQIVSGATQTSQGFIQSLQSALSQAKA